MTEAVSASNEQGKARLLRRWMTWHQRPVRRRRHALPTGERAVRRVPQ